MHERPSATRSSRRPAAPVTGPAVLLPPLLAGLLLASVVAVGSGCTGPVPPARPAGPAPSTAAPAAPTVPDDGRVHLTILHFNDIYEITPLQGGAVGGPARVATLRQRLLAENPNTLTLLAGDLLSPSALGTAEVDGERLAGRQMVAVLNALGLDFTTLGNHEFDLKREELEERLVEAGFGWVCGNVTWDDGSPLPHVAPYEIVTFGDPGGPDGGLRVGILGAVLAPSAKTASGYARIADPVETLAAQAAELRSRVDVLVALTHLSLEQDERLAATVPEIDLILGGHEHENWQLRRGADRTPILKADANVRTVHVVDVAHDPETGAVEVTSELVPITDAIPDHRRTAAVVAKWKELAFEGFRSQGFEPDDIVTTVPVELDGRESTVRNRSGALTDLIADAMLRAAPEASAAVYNSGSIRIDDVLPPGPITQYDVIRILPFGGEVVEVETSGALLARVLDQGLANRGTGGFLQTARITRDPDASGPAAWRVDGEPLTAAGRYRVALSDYLLTGEETGLDYLTPDHPDLRVLPAPGGGREDIRKAVIAELRAESGR